jgi:uncharacterized protein YlzI (FlbEa/FlbD family)
MSSYISTDNQNLLWRLLHQHHLFTQCTEEYKTNVFRETVETIYYEIQPNTSLTYKELQLLNQKTLQTIIQGINPPAKIQQPPSPPLPPKMQMVETSEEKSVREFKERHQMYENMSAKPNLPDASSLFEEQQAKGENNEVITNMDELLEKYQAQRDLDVPKIETRPDTDIEEKNIQQTISMSKYDEIIQRLIEVEKQVSRLLQMEEKLEARMGLLTEQANEVIDSA